MTTETTRRFASPLTEGLGPDATDVDLWAEIHRLRAAVAGPAGFASWQDAATAERVLRVKTQTAFGRLSDVAEERARQDAKWGGAEHDDHHSTADFVQLIEDYAGWARTMAGMDSPEKAERRLIQVAALAVAAVESSRRRRGACA